MLSGPCPCPSSLSLAALRAQEWAEALVQPLGGLELTPTQTRLLERLFAGCSKVEVARMHGGLSGSLVLRTASVDAAGNSEEPTVTKIDVAPGILREVPSRTCTLTRPPSPVGAHGAQPLALTQFPARASICRTQVRQTNFVTGLGVDAVKVMRGPIFADEQSTHLLLFADARIDGE